MKLRYDLSLSGDALYYENRDRWLRFHDGADALVVKNRDEESVIAEYRCPTRADFEGMKKVDELLFEHGLKDKQEG